MCFDEIERELLRRKRDGVAESSCGAIGDDASAWYDPAVWKEARVIAFERCVCVPLQPRKHPDLRPIRRLKLKSKRSRKRSFSCNRSRKRSSDDYTITTNAFCPPRRIASLLSDQEDVNDDDDGASRHRHLVVADDNMHYVSMRHQCFQIARNAGRAYHISYSVPGAHTHTHIYLIGPGRLMPL